VQKIVIMNTTEKKQTEFMTVTTSNGQKLTFPNTTKVAELAAAAIQSAKAITERNQRTAFKPMLDTYGEKATGTAFAIIQPFSKVNRTTEETGYLVERLRGAKVERIEAKDASADGVKRFKEVKSGGVSAFVKERKVLATEKMELSHTINIPFATSDNKKLSVIVGEALTTFKGLMWEKLQMGEKVFKNWQNIHVSVQVADRVICTSDAFGNSISIKDLRKTDTHTPTETHFNNFATAVFQALKRAEKAGAVVSMDENVSKVVTAK
jgi:hypothetical protein